MLDGTAKYGLHLLLSHQRMEQLSDLSQNIADAVMTGAQQKIFLGTNYKTAMAVVDELCAGTYDLQEVKEKITTTTTVGYKREIMHGGGEGKATHQVDSQVHSSGQATSFARVEMEGESEADIKTHGETDSEGETEGTQRSKGIGDGATTSAGTYAGGGVSSGTTFGFEDPGMMGVPFTDPDNLNVSSGQSDLSGATEGAAKSHNETSGQGESRARSRQHGTSDSVAHARGRNRVSGTVEGTAYSEAEAYGRAEGRTKSQTTSWQETLTPILKEVATIPYSLDEQRHREAVKLTELGVQQIIVQRAVNKSVVLHGKTITFTRPEPKLSEIRAFTRYLCSGASTSALGADTKRGSGKPQLGSQPSLSMPSTGPRKEPSFARGASDQAQAAEPSRHERQTIRINTPIDEVEREMNQRQLDIRKSIGPQVMPPPKPRVKSVLEETGFDEDADLREDPMNNPEY